MLRSVEPPPLVEDDAGARDSRMWSTWLVQIERKWKQIERRCASSVVGVWRMDYGAEHNNAFRSMAELISNVALVDGSGCAVAVSCRTVQWSGSRDVAVPRYNSTER
jgi:hypothetical protein